MAAKDCATAAQFVLPPRTIRIGAVDLRGESPLEREIRLLVAAASGVLGALVAFGAMLFV